MPKNGKRQNRRLHPIRKIVDWSYVVETEKSSPTTVSPIKSRRSSPLIPRKKVAIALFFSNLSFFENFCAGRPHYLRWFYLRLLVNVILKSRTILFISRVGNFSLACGPHGKQFRSLSVSACLSLKLMT